MARAPELPGYTGHSDSGPVSRHSPVLFSKGNGTGRVQHARLVDDGVRREQDHRSS